ncbi:amidase signature domain-containing protein [Whalleya microplaca]|nr:amidase signature domain-containing protein [Whalleya microplaca]
MAPTVTIANGAKWEEVAADRRRHRDATIAELDPPLPELDSSKLPLNTTGIPKTVLTAEELRITNANVEDLIPRIASGEYSTTAVTKAFLRRAGLAQKLTNCITELLPRRALRRAAELDAYLDTHKRPVGPLHGVPVSVKEHVGIKGRDLNAGFVAWVGRVAEEDALILQCLWEAGAVFYARTTQPQTLMHLETSNNLYGVTPNPYNTTLSAAGSSGGEGALLGLRGSVLGIGTDIGGSIRGPAGANGIFGFKPTSARLPVSGWSATMLQNESVIAAIGPMSTSLEGLRLFTKAVLDRRPWLHEPGLVALGWRDEKATLPPGRKIRLGVLWDDGVVKPHPPVLRGLTEVVEKLRGSERIELVDWKPWKHDWAWEILAKIYFPDGGAEEKAAIAASGEPWRPLSKWILQDNPHVRSHTVASLWAALKERNDYRAAYNELWNETASGPGTPRSTGSGSGTTEPHPVDAILCPVLPGVAAKFDTSRYWGYTAQWNLLDYPALVFPVGGDAVGEPAKEEPYAYPADYEPLSEADRYNWDLWREHGAEGYVGAPLSLQLVGRR